MYNWLCSDLAATNQDWVFTYWHHPPYTKGSHDSDVETQLEEMRERFNPVIEAHGADLNLTGHSHSYERSVLIDSHYGNSGSYSAGTHAKDSGDGDPAGDGAYQKPKQQGRGRERPFPDLEGTGAGVWQRQPRDRRGLRRRQHTARGLLLRYL